MIDPDLLIFRLRDKLNEIGIDHYDDKLAHRDLHDALDTIRMIADSIGDDLETFASYKIENCTVHVATYYAYRVYTKLAERQLATEPTSAAIQIQYDSSDARRCLTLLFGTPFTPELIPTDLITTTKVVAGKSGPSIANFHHTHGHSAEDSIRYRR